MPSFPLWRPRSTLVNRVATAIIAAAPGIGSVVLLGVHAGPVVTGTVTLNEVLGYIGMAVAAILIMRVLAGVVRDE